MTRRTTPARFPRGIADPSGERAFLRDQAGALVALDLRSGKVLWRTSAPMRPLLARDGKVVAAHPAGAHALEIAVLDAADGKQLKLSEPLALPDWIKVALDNTRDFILDAEEEDGALILRWAAETRYRGGAAPSAKVLKAAERGAGGAARVDLTTGAVEELPDAGAELPEEPPAATSGAAAPDVVEQREIGDKSFHLLARKMPSGTIQMLVRALDPKSSRTLWETIVDEAAARPPKPPRP